MQIRIGDNQLPYTTRLRYWLIKKLAGKRIVILNTVFTGKGSQYCSRYDTGEGLICDSIFDQASWMDPALYREDK